MSTDNLRFTETHEWARKDNGIVTVGISDHAVEQLHDVVFLDLPAVGVTVEKDKAFGSIESVKAVFDLNAPVSGKIVAVNEELNRGLEVLNKEPFDAGWMVKIQPTNLEELDALMNLDEYKKFIG